MGDGKQTLLGTVSYGEKEPCVQKHLSFLSLNVCGLKSKLSIPEFSDFISQFQIIGLQETKLDDVDDVSISGYKMFCNNREKISRYRSGGIAILVKENLAPFVKINKCKSKLILWFSISHKITCTNEDLHCGLIYIPPNRSRYSCEDPYLEIQTELNELTANSRYFILFGDLNSRTSNLKDYVLVDEFLSHMCDDDILRDENKETLYYFERDNVPLARNTSDKSTNTFGHQLLEFCRNNNMFILNGRFGTDRIEPKLTCKDASVVDYFISTAEVFHHIVDFEVLEFSPLYSDSHCAVALTLNMHNTPPGCTYSMEKSRDSDPIPKLWDREKSESFSINLDKASVLATNSKLDTLIYSDDVTESSINSIIDDISQIFMKGCEKTFGHYKPKSDTKKRNKPWFNTECFSARNTYHKIRRLYNKHKTVQYKSILNTVSKTYKNVMAKNIRQHRNERAEKLRKLKSSNPKDYWRILNSKSVQNSKIAALKDLYSYFKNVNESNIEDSTPYTNIPDCPINENINLPITSDEISKTIKSLKLNKAHGMDKVLNEHLKSSLDLMMPIYVKLFNLVFDSGIVPHNWLLGDILPIYKHKGDIKSPENYRPITLLSNLGKVFTAIISNRLSNFAEENDLISESQAGFRKGRSTTDNIFVINCLIEIFRSTKRKLYCTFVDFKQAFDRVWRDGLWAKLQNSNINGKCLNVIKNTYEKAKSRIITTEGSSAFFPCMIGVRQGDNLSPFLFSLYLNDLENYLDEKNVGLTVDYDDEDISVFLKLFVLLYADDTVIFGDSPEELQKSLNAFEQYCDEWKLTINTNKTKVIIFSHSKAKSNLHFYLNDTELEIVNDFTYLGVKFSKSGSFKSAKEHIAEQGNKALFSLLRKIRDLNLPYDVQIDLFEKTIKPVLLYGCEVWGSGNCDIIERVNLKFLKTIFQLKKSTPSFMIYGELGITPIMVDIQSRIISYWSKAVHNESNSLVSVMYKILYSMHKNGIYKSKYIDNVKTIIEHNGFSNIWISQNAFNITWFSKSMKQKLKDQSIQTWSSLVECSSSGTNYRIFKDSFGTSLYLKKLPEYFARIILAFRTRNHKLPIETGRWRGIPRKERICKLCNKDIGDEFHYIMSCKVFDTDRRKFIKPYFYTNPNTIKFNQLMNESNIKQLTNLACFIKTINRKCPVSF